ncbi:MAG: hypothetical protein ABIN61_08910 [candidate division WOR-3 bacterium]
MRRIIEKTLFSALLVIALWGLIYFFLPQRVEAKAVFGIRHPSWPIETCWLVYPLNCSVVYPD